MNLPTVIILLVVLAMVIVALRVLRTGKGKCSCDSNTKKTASGNKCAGCAFDCPFKR